MKRLARFWRYRQDHESREVMDRHILTPDDITCLNNPIFQLQDSSLSNTARNFLGRDRKYFENVQEQLQSMLRVWNLIIEQKKRHDNLQGLTFSATHESLEAFILCGHFIPSRASIAPLSPSQVPQTLQPPRVTQQLSIAPAPTSNPPPSTGPRRILEIDITSCNLKQLGDSTASASDKQHNKRTFSNMQGHTHHEDGQRKKMK